MPGLNEKILLLNVFIAGFAVMSLEILAIRVLANFFGYSVFVWGTAIGVILLALTVGYYAGGIIADKVKNAAVLYAMIIFSGLYLAAFLFFYQGAINNLSAELSLINSVLISSLLVLFIPSLLLSTASPIATKLLLREKNQGKTIGFVYALSNTGSIIGTFSTTFFLVTSLGVRNSIALNVFLCVFSPLLGLVYEKRKYLVHSVVFLLVVSSFIVLLVPEKSSYSIYRKESVYNTIEIKKFGSTEWLVLNSHPMSYYENEPKLETYFYDAVAAVPCIKNTERFLDLGLAGATVERKMQKFCKVASLDGVELDPEVIEASDKFFDIRKIENLNIFADDARNFIRHCSKKYSVIFNNTINAKFVPFHLTTKEFFSEVGSCLEEDGLFINYSFYGKDKTLFKDSLARTMKEAFPVVSEVDFEPQGVALLFAFKSQNSYDDFLAGINYSDFNNEDLKYIFSTIKKADSEKGFLITDDKNPVDNIALLELI